MILLEIYIQSELALSEKITGASKGCFHRTNYYSTITVVAIVRFVLAIQASLCRANSDHHSDEERYGYTPARGA